MSHIEKVFFKIKKNVIGNKAMIITWFALKRVVRSNFRVSHSLQLAKATYEVRFARSLVTSLTKVTNLRSLSAKEINWLSAFSQYNISQGIDMSSKMGEIRLVWAPFPEGGNFGDWLSPYIFKKFSNRAISYFDYSLTGFEQNVLGIGSILHKCGKESLVLGSGIQSLNSIKALPKKVFLIRGPHSREEIIRAGGACPKVYGDPVFLLQSIYQPRVDISGVSEKFVFAPHVNHRNLEIQLPENVDILDLGVSRSNDIESTIDALIMAKGVLTSSLHAYAICLTFGIPARLINFPYTSSKIPGDGVKFRDLVEGADLPFEPPLKVGLDLRDVKIARLLQRKQVKESVSMRIHDAFVELVDFLDEV